MNKLIIYKDKGIFLEKKEYFMQDSHEAIVLDIKIDPIFDKYHHKFIEFETPERKWHDELTGNTYKLPHEVTKNETARIDIMFVGTDENENEKDFSDGEDIYFKHSINASEDMEEEYHDTIVEILDRTEQLEEDVNSLEGSAHSHTNKQILDNTTASYTTEEKTKLQNVEANAQVNRIEKIKANGTEQTINNKEVNISIPTKTSQLENDSGFITKSVNDLDNYTTTNNMNTAISGAVGTETTNRQNADLNLQQQIDAITSASDVVDVVATYTDLQNYDTTKLTADDVIKVMQDSTHNNAISYFRWVITNNVGVWNYVGSEGPFYTKGETETILANYYNKSQVYNKTEIDGMIGDIETALTNLNTEAEAI